MEQLLASLTTKPLLPERGQQVTGKVISTGEKEIILDIGAKAEGVISTREIGSKDLEKIKVGEKITAFVQEVENESGQVMLSLQVTRRGPRQRSDTLQKLTPEAWVASAGKYTKGEIFKGTVTKITQNGVFVQLEEGIDGFIPGSKLSPDQKLTEGQPTSVIVDSIDAERRRIALAPVLTSTKGLIYK